MASEMQIFERLADAQRRAQSRPRPAPTTQAEADKINSETLRAMAALGMMSGNQGQYDRLTAEDELLYNRQQDALDRDLEFAQMALDAQNNEGIGIEPRLGSVPQGMQEVIDPESGERRLEYITGAPKQMDQISADAVYAAAIDDIDRMQGMIEKHGTELFGKDASTMRLLRGQILSHIAKLRNMGVLQQGELEMLEQQLPDPSSYASIPKFRSAMSQAYKELSDQFKRRRTDEARAFGLEVPDYGQPATPSTSGQSATPVGPPRTLNDGTTWQEYSDGSIKQVSP